MKSYKGVKNPVFTKIKRNRDHKGRILTYSTYTQSGYELEHNTIGEARVFAFDDIATSKKNKKRRLY